MTKCLDFRPIRIQRAVERAEPAAPSCRGANQRRGPYQSTYYAGEARKLPVAVTALDDGKKHRTN